MVSPRMFLGILKTLCLACPKYSQSIWSQDGNLAGSSSFSEKPSCFLNPVIVTCLMAGRSGNSTCFCDTKKKEAALWIPNVDPTPPRATKES
ncbi:uncharacterized protein BKA78DRAFT_311839 [Phyllosticta capitalensis]|uniref:uncharacterized protein n=1 Tax=Phyllosticta capitalensis TaxID=121624 RepID=UPI003131507B